MPLYEYRCRGCGHQFEILQRLGEGAEGLSCPRCSAGELEKQFSVFATATGATAAREAAACDMPDCGAGACCGGGCAAGDFDSFN